MAKRVFKVSTFTPVAVADATNFTNSGHMSIQGGSGTQQLQISEVFASGQATSSAPTNLILSRHSTVGATLTALTTAESDASFDPASAALAAPAAPFTASTTKPQRSATLGLNYMGFNAFGGLARWQAYDEKDMIKTLGNTASLGELGLSCYSGGTPGAIGAHIIYEPK